MRRPNGFGRRGGLQDCTINTAKTSHVPRTQGIIRLKPLHAALRSTYAPLTAGLLLLGGGAQAADAKWDCRMAADGRNWQCYRDGQLVADPSPTANRAPAQATPLAEPAVQQATPLDQIPRPAPEPTPPPADAHRPETTENAVDAAAPAALVPAPASAAIDRPAAVAPEAPPTAPPPTRPPAQRPVAAPATGQAASQAFQTSEMPDLLQPGTAITPAAPAPGPVQSMQAEPAQTVSARTETAPMPAPGSKLPATQSIAGGLDNGIDWTSCQVSRTPAPGMPAAAAHDVSTPIEVGANAVVANLDPQQAVFSGQVQLIQGSLQMQADQLTLDRSTGEISAQGGFLLSQPDIRVAGSTASYQLATGQGKVNQASFRVPAIRARGDAGHAELLGGGRSQMRDISYTTCAPGNADWLLTAEALELDQQEGFGTAHNASLRFFGVPILYAPRFTFPISDRRRSGVLIPSVGYTSNTGADLSVPYYLNLAENYDLTLTPRLMSKRGLMLGGEFRYLTETSNGKLSADFLPSDNEYRNGSDDRGSAALRSHTQFNPRTEAEVRLNYVSDNDYLSDLGGSLAVTSATHLERTGELRYHGDTWNLLGRVQGYQTIDEAIAAADRPYSRLPQLLVELEQPQGIAGTTYHLDAEYVNFYRDNSVRGHRIDLFPAISLPLGDTWWFVEPKVGARYTAYELTDQAAGLDDSPSQLSGMLSLDSGLYFDRSANYFGSGVTQTLEPRLYYLFVPHNNQDDQPIFDTALFDFSFDNLFRENRFNGPDRFGDANQVTLALTSRMVGDETGAELLRASLGQIIYFEDRKVTLPGMTHEDSSTSALVGELAAQLGGGWQARTGLQWDPNDGGDPIDQALAQVSYRDNDRHVFSAAYRLRDGVNEQTDLAFFWPVNEQFTVIGRHNYSLQDNRLLEALAGIEYGRCCWRVRVVARQYTDDIGNDHNLALMVQLELNGLGRLGQDIDKTLERGIYGYRTGEDE